MTDREALTDSSNYAQYLTLVHSDSFDKDEAADKETLNTEQANPLANGDGASDVDREALNEELEKIDAEIKTLKTVLASKQKRAADIRKTLGSTIVTDMKDKVKTIQESDVIMRTNQAFKSAGEKTSAAFSNFGKKMVDVNSKLRESIGTSFNNVKKSKSLFALPSAARVNSGSRFERMTSEEPTTSPTSPTATSKDLPTSTIADEDVSLYTDLDDTPY